MSSRQPEKSFRVWGTDHVVYGPLELARITEWIESGRLTSGTWVYSEAEASWRRAAEIAELKEALKEVGSRRDAVTTGSAVGVLRGIDLFAGLTDAQIESFLEYGDLVEVPQFTEIARTGDRGDAMFIVLEGEVRAYLIVDGRECTLSCINPGEFIGEISLLDEGPRSADLAVNCDTKLLRISAEQFRALCAEAPGLATPFLLALSRGVVQRIRSATQRYEDSIQFMGRKIAGWA